MPELSNKLINKPPVKFSEIQKKGKTELDFVFSGLLAGSTGLLVGAGGAGKSFFAMGLAASIATGRWAPGACTLGFIPQIAGHVAYFNLEDPQVIIENRLYDLMQHFADDADAIEMLEQNLDILPLAGSLLAIADKNGADQFVVAEIKEFLRSKNTRLMIIDTVSRSHRMDENDNSQMALFNQILTNIAEETGAAILAIHHVNKQALSTNKNQEIEGGIRGASALKDNARWVGYLSNLSEEECGKLYDPNFTGYISSDHRKKYAKFEIAKSNYKMAEEVKYFRRAAGGVLLPASLSPDSRAASKGIFTPRKAA